MCGIAGFIHLGEGRDVSSSRLIAMLKPIHHRGPDDDGVWMGLSMAMSRDDETSRPSPK